MIAFTRDVRKYKYIQMESRLSGCLGMGVEVGTDCIQTCNIFGDEMFFQWIVVIVAQLYKFTNTH